MNLIIHNLEEAERPHLAACIKRVVDFYGDEVQVDVTPEIWCRRREANGWLEYAVVLPYIGGVSKLYVGAIQRNQGAEVEFHS